MASKKQHAAIDFRGAAKITIGGAAGTSGQVLTSGGSGAMTWGAGGGGSGDITSVIGGTGITVTGGGSGDATVNTGGLIKLSSATIVSGELILTGLTGYKNFLITGSGLVSNEDLYDNTSGNFVKAQLGTGSTFVTDYYFWRERVFCMDSDGADDYGQNSSEIASGTQFWGIGPVSGNGSSGGGSAYSGADFTMHLGNPTQAAAYGWMFYHSEGIGLEGELSTYMNSSAASQVPVPCLTSCHGCFRHASAQPNSIKITSFNGSLVDGYATLYGISTA